MSNCLKTQLIASVQNDSLPILGNWEMELAAITQKAKIYITIPNGTAKIIGSGHFYSSDNTDLGQNISLSTENIYINNTSNTDKLVINSKYDIEQFNTADNSFSVLKSGAHLDATFLSSMENLILSNRDKPELNIEDLGNSINIITFNNPYNSVISGNVETLVESQVSNGRNSGTFVIGAAHTTGILLNGTNVFESRAAICISFISATSVVIYDGTTPGGTTIASWDGSTWTY